MCNQARSIRDLFWSELCLTDFSAYKEYLAAVENGLRLVTVGDLDGTAELFGSERGCVDDDLRAKPAFVLGGDAGEGEVVDINANSDIALGTKDNVDSGIGQSRLGFCDRGFSIDSAGGCKRGDAGSGIDANLQSKSSHFHAEADGRSVGLQIARGHNYARNKANREAKKRRKQARLVESEVVEKKGFWNSCSEEVRKQLIDSKARMHIADNIRKAKESEMRAKEVGSPYDLMLKAVKMADFAEKQSANSDTNRVYGWAKTVATSSAESLARSVPSSVPSFQDLVEKLEASSQSSFELDLARKDSTIAELEKRIEEQDDDIRELRFQQAASENRFSLLAVATDRLKVNSSVGSTDERCAKTRRANKPDDRFVPTRAQPWKHITINRAQVYAE